jgi:hypothetical protein
MILLQSVHKGLHVNTLEQLYTHKYQHNNILIPEQNVASYLQLQHAGA